jgi:predicted Rossmann fold nucleotide-binding protein DprA/Smf involved in DNA uptake
MQNRTFALHLAMTPGIGGKSVIRILTRNSLLGRSPEEFLALSPEAYREEYRLGQKAIEGLSGRTIGETAEIEKRLSELGVTLATAADAHYPTCIEEMDPDPPGVLFMYGNLRLLESPTFTVMSSRNSHPADLEMIERLTEEGVLNNETLVSGHDRPEYQRAAIVPLRWGSPRILCLDRGLFQVLGEDLRTEAFRTARLWRYQFDPKMDLVVTPFRPDAKFVGINNKLRDRLIGCLSQRLTFVRINEGGNMDQIARMALKAGRKVAVTDRSETYLRYRAEGAEIIREFTEA